MKVLVYNKPTEPTPSSVSTVDQDPVSAEWVLWGSEFGKRIAKLEEDCRNEMRCELKSLFLQKKKNLRKKGKGKAKTKGV